VKRSRRGGRRPQNGPSGHSSGSNGGGGGGGGYNPNRVYDSNGPEIKIRGTASHVYEKYLQMARDANASGDRVMAENYLQHAEHYFRIMAAVQAQAQQYQQQQQALQPLQPAQPQQPSGTEEQPFVGQPPAQQSSAPSFSLNESVGNEEEDDEGEEEEEVEVQE
jgi:hypothetical protein